MFDHDALAIVRLFGAWSDAYWALVDPASQIEAAQTGGDRAFAPPADRGRLDGGR